MMSCPVTEETDEEEEEEGGWEEGARELIDTSEFDIIFISYNWRILSVHPILLIPILDTSYELPGDDDINVSQLVSFDHMTWLTNETLCFCTDRKLVV